MNQQTNQPTNQPSIHMLIKPPDQQTNQEIKNLAD